MESIFKNKIDNLSVELPTNDEELSLESVPMTPMRKAISKAMVNSHTNNAAFTGMREIDITNIYKLRNDIKEECEKKGVKLTYLAFFVKAVACALEKMPNINVRIDNENNAIIYIKNINVSIAVDTPKGLMVPVIKGANKLNILQIAKKIEELAQKARDFKLSLKEMKDGTFTLSNYGVVKLDYATPVINSPESAILGVGNITKKPVYDGDVIKPGYMIPFSITADHRVIDGADAGRFLNEVSLLLSDPEKLLD